MPTTTSISAHLEFEVAVEGRPPVHGTLRGARNRLQLEVDDPSAFAGSEDAPVIRALADQLAGRGVSIAVVHDGEHLVTIGATRSPWWQRPATRSRHIRLGSLRGAWTSARSRSRRTVGVLPGAALVPPPTMFPLAPTFQRRPRRPVTTTHDPARGGGARLVMAVNESSMPGERQAIFWLDDRVTTIGSAPTCDVVLPGLAQVHAEVRHDENDEFVLVTEQSNVKVHGAPTRHSALRTGARVELGVWRMSYYREEFADHGRPYGGRIGGELGHQRPQPPRS